MEKLNFTLREYIFKVLIGLIVVLFATINLSVIGFSEENTLGKIPAKGLVSEEGLPSYTDEEFQKAPIRITVFSATWCTYCKELKQEFPKEIYSKYDKNTVAIRVWEIDSKEVVDYFQQFADKNQIPQEIKSQIPFIFINEQYPYLGYSKEITSNILEDIESILNGKEVINGGNIDLDNNSNYKTGSEENTLQNKIEKDLETGEINAVHFMQAGMGDNFKSIFLILFSLLFFYFLSFRKRNKGLIGAIYLISILIFNILSSSTKIPELLNVKYVEAIKIGLYILFGIIIGELIINFILGSRNNNSKLVDKIIHIFNSKIVIILSFLSGFLLMNSQIYNNNTYYSLIIKSIKGNQILLDKFYIVVLYSVGLILGNIVLIWIIKSVVGLIKGLTSNFKFRNYI